MKKGNNTGIKLFVYKTLFVFVLIFILFKVTIGYKIDQYERYFSTFKSDQGREYLRDNIRSEIKKSLEKENLLNDEDRILLKNFINKLKDELK